jgi:hypothetical protein
VREDEMIAVLIQLLVLLLVLCVVWYIIKIAAGQFGLPSVFVQIAGLIIALIFLLYALRVLGVGIH